MLNITRTRLHTEGEFEGRDETYVPVQRTKGLCTGSYQVAQKSRNVPKHHAPNQVCVISLEEVAEKIREGYSVWMKGDLTGQTNLIAPANIKITE